MRDDALPRADKDQMKRLDEKKSIERNELAAGAGHPIGGLQAFWAGRCRSDVRKAKSSPYDGPAAANQLQQQNLAQQNVLQESQDIAADAANKPVMTHAAPASASQAVTVQAEGWSWRQSLLRPHHLRFPRSRCPT